jgi:collagenase-like PrtC family protease
MKSLEFSIPYNGQQGSLSKIFAMDGLNGNKIREVYLAGPREYSASARITPRMSLDEFTGVVDQIHARGLRVNLLLNAVCEGSHWYDPEVIDAKLEYIGLLHEKHGVEAITIANPIYIQEVRRSFPKIQICASVLSLIDSVQRAVYFNELGADVIIPDTAVNKDLKLLKKMKDAVDAEFKLMVNKGCIYKCPFERFHGVFTAHRSTEVDEMEGCRDKDVFNTQNRRVFFTGCVELTDKDRYLIFQSPWIRPEDLRQYEGIADYFKVVGRALPKWETICRAYMMESWDGNLLELMDAALRWIEVDHSLYIDNKKLGEYNFFDKLTSCDKNCKQCNYCQELAANLITEKPVLC